MKIYILTQEDAFYLPKLIDKLINKLPKDVEVAGAAIIKGEIAFENIPRYFELLGVRGFLYNGIDFAKHKLLDWLSVGFDFSTAYSVKGAFRKNNIPVYNYSDIATKEFLEHVEEKKIDLIISLACPQIINKELMNTPQYGCINLHGALLPEYRGKLPSFWVLLNDEAFTGVTVHIVNEKLDDGPIIVQKKVAIEEDDTMHSLILRSKINYGIMALEEAIESLKNNNVNLKKNDSSRATYFSFPDSTSIQKFKEKGKRVR